MGSVGSWCGAPASSGTSAKCSLTTRMTRSTLRCPLADTETATTGVGNGSSCCLATHLYLYMDMKYILALRKPKEKR